MRIAAERQGLREGVKIEIRTVSAANLERIKGGVEVKRRKGTVIGLFEHWFLCDMGRWKEGFRYNEVIGRETGKQILIKG